MDVCTLDSQDVTELEIQYGKSNKITKKSNKMKERRQQ